MFCRPTKKKRLNVFYGRLGKTVKEKVVFKSSHNPREENHQEENADVSHSSLSHDYQPYEEVREEGCIAPEIPSSNTGSSSRYDSEKRSRLENWENLRNQFFQTYIDGQTVSTGQCFQCQMEDSNLFRCIDCCPWQHICSECLLERHGHPHLHKFEVWKEKAFMNYETETPVWKTDHNFNCEGGYIKSIIIVDEKGRQHNRSIQFCHCELECMTLVHLHLWPSSLRCPKLAFQMDFLKSLYGLFVEGSLSVKAFCESLKARATKHDKPYVTQHVQDIYRSLMTETWEEFRQFLYKLEYSFDDGTSCPACFSSSSKFYSFDADFQLVRKSTAGKEWSSPKHDSHFFLNQKEVDDFLSDYSTAPEKPLQDCSDFQAGSNLRSKSKFGKLDETAVFGSTCRHGLPKHFFSLKHGERLGYAVYLLQKIVKEEANNGQLFIMYDIACSLKNHLVKQGQEDLLDKVTLSIPIFHAYGHKVPCQILYGPRNTAGMGLTDGESVERLWSYLGQFSKITKETTPENRVDLLVDALLHYSQKLKDKLGSTLPQKFMKATEIQAASQKSLDELLKPFQSINEDSFLEWIEEEKQYCNKQQTVSFTPEEEYARSMDLLCKIDSTAENSGQQKSIKKRIESFEKKNGFKWTLNNPSYISALGRCQEKERKQILSSAYNLASERDYLLNLIRKYARGQAISNRLSRQVKSVNNKIRQLIIQYNLVGGVRIFLPLKITFDDVKDAESGLYSNNNICEPSFPPSCVKVRAIRLKNLIERSKEEQLLTKEEMMSTVEFYLSLHSKLVSYTCSSEISSGLTALAVKEGLFIESKIAYLCDRFANYIRQVAIPDYFRVILGLSESGLKNYMGSENFLDGDDEVSEDDYDSECGDLQ